MVKDSEKKTVRSKKNERKNLKENSDRQTMAFARDTKKIILNYNRRERVEGGSNQSGVSIS